MVKKCTRCSKEASEDEFNKQTSSKDGLNSACKACVAAKNKTYYEDNKRDRKEYNAKYHQKHSVARNALARERYKKAKKEGLI